MDLHSGEHVLFSGHPSWRSILAFYFKGLLLTAVAAAIAALVTKIAQDEVKGATVALVAVVVFAIVLVVGFIKRIATTYTISNQRLHIRRGIIARHEQQTRLDRVQNVNTNQSVIERILQVGTVDFDTAGTDDSDFSFVGVAQPEKVVAEVAKAQREGQAGTDGLGGVAAPPPAAPPPAAPPPPPAAG